MNLIQSLKRKYGATAGRSHRLWRRSPDRNCNQLEQRDAELARLNAELQKLDAEIWRAGQELSAQRRKAIPQLVKAAMKQLKDLGFNQSHFE